MRTGLLRLAFAAIAGFVLAEVALPPWCGTIGSAAEFFVRQHPRAFFLLCLAIVIGVMWRVAAGSPALRKLSAVRLGLLAVLTWILFEIGHSETLFMWLGEAEVWAPMRFFRSGVMTIAITAVLATVTVGAVQEPRARVAEGG